MNSYFLNSFLLKTSRQDKKYDQNIWNITVRSIEMPPGINEGINKPKIPPTLNKTKKLSIKPPLNNKFAMFVSIPRPNPITNENAP